MKKSRFTQVLDRVQLLIAAPSGFVSCSTAGRHASGGSCYYLFCSPANPFGSSDKRECRVAWYALIAASDRRESSIEA
jgi:hypothetical protein